MENLGYWNLRAVEARIDNDNGPTPATVEMVAFTRCMVAIIEAELFNRKDVK